jgi:hypothetical protein
MLQVFDENTSRSDLRPNGDCTAAAAMANIQLESNPSNLCFAEEFDSKAIDNRIQGLLDLLNDFENKNY